MARKAKKTEAEVVNPTTGEVQSVSDLLAAPAPADSYNPNDDLNSDVLKALDKASKAKASDFRKTDSDIVKLNKPGQTFTGVYLKSLQGSKYLIHFFATKGEKGEPRSARMLGTTIITRELQKIQPGTAVRMDYVREDKTPKGHRLSVIDVSVLK